jgi:hypothetical protein
MPVGTVPENAICGAKADIVVTVVAGLGCNPLEQCRHVAEQQRVVFVDDDGGRGVESLNIDETSVDS